MDERVVILARALKMAEEAHARAEKAGHVGEWPEFYAQWLLDNPHLWAPEYGGCVGGQCAVHDHD